jgi:Putative transposase DNA-binding domain
VKQAIIHLKLNRANPGKLHKLDELAAEYQRVVQAYVDWLIARQVRQPTKYAAIPEQDVPTPLSDRWQRCAWQQACGIVQSWAARVRQNPPILRNICIQANANVVVIEPSGTPTCDFWLRTSTLAAGKPVRVPIVLYGRAKEAIAEFPKLCTGVTLNRRGGQWYATFIVERRTPKFKSKAVIGIDIGMTNIVSTSEGNHYGHISPQLRQRVERAAAKRRCKQKLNACLKRKGKPTVELTDQRAEAFARNEIGRALNHMLAEWPEGAAAAVERLTVKEMRFKSRQMNRVLRVSQLGYVRDKLKFKLDERGIRDRSVQPAYSSQECSHSGFTLSMHCRSRAEFACLWCGYTANADENAAANLAKRFGDAALNTLLFHEVEATLAVRFMRRFPGAHSASAGLELQPDHIWLPKSKAVVAGESPPTVNQPGQDPCHICL